MRKALIVGIDHYPNAPLQGCVNDADRMHKILARHHDGALNFSAKKLTSRESKLTRAVLRKQLRDLFAHKTDVVLFYFAGHGLVNEFGGYLVTQDSQRHDEGVAMADVLCLANQSPSDEVVIILDCCQSGAMGIIPALQNEQAHLREGVSVLCASRASQAAMEKDGGGVFTALICEALEGGAADIIGNVTVAGVYAFVDQALGPWDQRPLFKSHVSSLLPLRKCASAVDLELLRLLPFYFEEAKAKLHLAPTYEPTYRRKKIAHSKIFSHLLKYRDARLVAPVGANSMYDAAMKSKACRLTALGQFYWKLASEGNL